MRLLAKQWHTDKWVDATWSDLVESKVDSQDTCGVAEQAQDTANSTARLLGEICELLIEHKAIPELVLFNLLTNEYDEKFKLIHDGGKVP